MVPSIVFDLSNFISSVVSACNIEFTEAKEIESRKLFQKEANNFISSFVPKESIDYKGYLDKEEKKIKVNAIYTCTDKSKLIIINYITGTNIIAFNNSIYKADMIFGMANDSKFGPHIKNKIAIVNNVAQGYAPTKSDHFLKYLSQSTSAIQIHWTERESLKKYLN